MKEINVYVDPYLELINSVLLTSRYNEITAPYIGYGLMADDENEYTSSIKLFFSKYKDHKIYEAVENMIPYGFIFSRPVEIALSLKKRTDFTVHYTLSSLCTEYCGGIEKINEFLTLLKDLALKSNYFMFFEQQRKFYDIYLNKAVETVKNANFADMLEKEYGKTQNSYNYVISSLMKGNFGIHFKNSETQMHDLFSVFTTDTLSMSPGILLHEYSHPFINPLTEKYIELVLLYSSAYDKLERYKLQGYKSGYGDFEECVNEHLVRAMTIHLLQKTGYTDLAKELLKIDLDCGYRYIPLILDKYKEYDQRRNLYPDFDSFYPALIDVFSLNID